MNVALAQPACVVNCAAYDRDGHRRDIALEQISDVLAIDDAENVRLSATTTRMSGFLR